MQSVQRSSEIEISSSVASVEKILIASYSRGCLPDFCLLSFYIPSLYIVLLSGLLINLN